MKKTMLLLICSLLLSPVFAQNDSILPPFKKFPTYPPVRLLRSDSAQFTKEHLDKKSAVLLMTFNPQCEHCQHETEEIVKNIDRFKNIQIVMATPMPFDSMLSFRKKYGLERFANIVVTQDTHFFLPSFYDMHSLPFLAFYNRKKELISVFEGSMPIEKVLAEFDK